MSPDTLAKVLEATMASGVAVTSLKRTHSAEVAKDKIVSFCREVSFEKANGLRSGWIGDRCSGILHKVLLELVNSIMNFTFMTLVSPWPVIRSVLASYRVGHSSLC